MLLLLPLFLLLVCSTAFAQAASLPVTDIATNDAVGQLLQSLGGLKGASGLAIAAAITQAVVLFFRTPLANFAGKYRLLIVLGLNIGLGVLTLMTQGGLSVGAALLHSMTLSAFSVFGHQVYKQLTEKKDAPPTGGA